MCYLHRFILHITWVLNYTHLRFIYHVVCRLMPCLIFFLFKLTNIRIQLLFA